MQSTGDRYWNRLFLHRHVCMFRYFSVSALLKQASRTKQLSAKSLADIVHGFHLRDVDPQIPKIADAQVIELLAAKRFQPLLPWTQLSTPQSKIPGEKSYLPPGRAIHKKYGSVPTSRGNACSVQIPVLPPTQGNGSAMCRATNATCLHEESRHCTKPSFCFRRIMLSMFEFSIEC